LWAQTEVVWLSAEIGFAAHMAAQLLARPAAPPTAAVQQLKKVKRLGSKSLSPCCERLSVMLQEPAAVNTEYPASSRHNNAKYL